MRGQPPVVWDHAEGFHVYDAYGNYWIDWSSGVLITNAGHGRRQMIDAIVEQANSGLLTNYAFPSEIRSRLVFLLRRNLPRRDLPQMKLNPRKLKVSGLPSPR